jgi:transaldolase
MQLIRDIRQIYDVFEYETEILAASIRNPLHVEQAALAGADCATIPPPGLRRPRQAPVNRSGALHSS